MMSTVIYKFSKSFFLTSDMVRRLEGRIAILYPSSRQAIIKKVSNQLIKIYGLSIITILILFMFADVSLYFVTIAVATVFILADSSMRRGIDKLEIELLGHFLEFIEAVKFRFQFDGMLEEALFDAIGECGYQMSVHGQIIYNHLAQSYFKERCDYQEVCPNHFFLTFYSLCESVMKYGDKKTEDGSLFVKNLGYLKEDINIQLLKKKNVENTFMGLTGICIIPVYCIKPIEMWGVSNMPELAESYNGRFGILSTILLGIMSLIIYEVIMSLKYPASMAVGKKAWVEKLGSLESVKKINNKYMNCFLDSMVKLEILLKSVAYPYNIAEYCIKRVVSAIGCGVLSAAVALSIGMGLLSLTVFVMGFMVSYWGQVIIIKLKRQLMLIEREDEVIRFQGIILMLMHADKITVEQLLSQLERFAVNFKKTIEEISDKLSFKGMSVFREYRDKSDFLPFNRIIDGFIACDEMYIHKAFEDVESDRRYYIERHKQENVHYIQQRGAIGKFLSFIPLCSVILVKLIIPFVIEGMRQMTVNNMGF